MENKNYRIRQLLSGKYVAEVEQRHLFFWTKWYGVDSSGITWDIGSLPYAAFCLKKTEGEAMDCLAGYGI